MTFVAGAIVGNLMLDTSGFVGGIAGAVAAATSGGPSIAAPLIAAADLAARAFGAAVNFIKDAVSGAAEEFGSVGRMAEQVGVSSEFLSAVGAAAKAAGSDVEELADVMKDLSEKTGLAAKGEEAEVEAFARLGMSQKEVQSLMGDSEAMFLRVADALAALPTTAEKNAAAMGLLSDGGSKLLPMFNRGADGIMAFKARMDELGATVTGEAASQGQAFGELGVLVDAAWTGIRNAVAQPILAAIAGDGDKLADTVVKIAEVIRSVIPPALNVIATIVDVILAGLDKALMVAQGLAGLSDAVGLTDKAGQGVATFRQANAEARNVVNEVKVQVSAAFDADAATSQIADKMAPELRAAARYAGAEYDGAARRAVVAANVGARNS